MLTSSIKKGRIPFHRGSKMPAWKEKLADRIDPVLAEESDVFETQMVLRRQGKLDEKIFAETRLRRGCYGQRYDNGHRHDGIRTQQLSLSDVTKGPETLWDAPGMQRIKIPFGGVTPDQLDTLAEVAEEYSDSVLHVTTRQDFQLHYVHMDDTPNIMRRLGAVGITTREACGNSVRNVTACPIAGVCRSEIFDFTQYAKSCWKKERSVRKMRAGQLICRPSRTTRKRLQRNLLISTDTNARKVLKHGIERTFTSSDSPDTSWLPSCCLWETYRPDIAANWRILHGASVGIMSARQWNRTSSCAG